MSLSICFKCLKIYKTFEQADNCRKCKESFSRRSNLQKAESITDCLSEWNIDYFSPEHGDWEGQANIKNIREFKKSKGRMRRMYNLLKSRRKTP